MDQQGPYTYENAGYSPFMERNPRTFCANEIIDNQISPFIESVVDNAIIYDPFSDMASLQMNPSNQTVSANQISGGTLQSDNGNLKINLTSGTLNYNDGIVNLLNVGGSSANGTPNSLTAQNAQGQTILSS